MRPTNCRRLKISMLQAQLRKSPTFISQAPAALRAFAAEHQNDENVSVVDQPVIEGTFVNGQAVAEAPKLEDHLRSK